VCVYIYIYRERERERFHQSVVTALATERVGIAITMSIQIQAAVRTSPGAPPVINEVLHVRFEVFTAVTMKNVVFWDIKTQFVLHRRHITSPLQIPAS
jgi:hypothetical protein